MRRLLPAISINCGLALPLWLMSDLTGWESAAVALFAYNLLAVVYQFGRSIVLIDLITCVAALEMVFMPAVYYHLFPLSMAVSSPAYFQFAYPAVVAVQLGINYPFRLPLTHREYVQTVRKYLEQNTHLVYYLILIGLAGILLNHYAPSDFKTLFAFFISCAKVGALYAYYSCSRFKYVTIVAVLSILLLNTVLEGMFGELFFWLILWTIYIAVDTKWMANPFNKFILFTGGLYFLLLIQSLKFEYRTNTWGATQGERQGSSTLMLALVQDRIQNPGRIFVPEAVAISTARFNQGSLLSAAMAHVPKFEPYAQGEVLFSLLIPLIPRIIWPDKPMTGGHENIRRFTTLPQFSSTSINISPLGEAYVNFGVIGGVIYLFFFGLLLNYWYKKILQWSASRPTILLWLPVLFFSALNMDTDLLSVWGTLVVNGLLLFLFYKFSDYLGLKL